MSQHEQQSDRADTLNPQGSLADLIGIEDEELLTGRISRDGWVKIGILGVLVSAFYWGDFLGLFNQWISNPDWTFGAFIPLFSLYLLYIWRREILVLPRRVCLWGLGLVLLAMCIKASGVVVLRNDWIVQLSIPVMIFGLVLYLCGLKTAWLCFVPIFFLSLAMPLPNKLYTMVSLPLQNLAATLSTKLLMLFGAQITVAASSMEVTSLTGKVHPLQVAEACSGMRSLLGFFALGVLVAYIQERPFWQRAVIILAGIPIAIGVNILRVAGTSVMFLIDKKELGEDFMHNAMGMILMIPALLLLFLLAHLLDSMYEEVDDDEEDGEDKKDADDTGSAELLEGKV
ncbi:MAG: exosortase/archaeosortase family protein [Phycisphaerae bacterium]|nr:exosortase/archaeosortase family protein [Phycisphaerae bacterium]